MKYSITAGVLLSSLVLLLYVCPLSGEVRLEDEIKALSSWTGEVEAYPARAIPSGRLIAPSSITPGTSSVLLSYQDSTGRIKTVAVRLVWTHEVLFAARNIKKGTRITALDVVKRPMRITRPVEYAVNIEEVDGYYVNRLIRQGDPVELRNLSSPLVLRKNRPVKIIAQYGSARASIDGITLEEGKPGDWIRVRRADDRRVILRARIINDNTVEVNVE